MMKLTMVLATACALLSVPAFGQSQNAPTGSAQAGQTISARDLVNQVVLVDMFDVQLAKIAEQNGDNTDKTFAREEIQVHSKATNDLKALVMSGKVNAPIPSAVDGEYQQKLDALQKLSGNQFDSAFRNDEIQSHRDEVAIVEQYAKNGDNADLKRWAETNLPTLIDHLNKAEKLS